jgi:UDP-glucose 4-epimerase
MTRAVVTGGAGFIGSHVTEGLLRQGYSVLVLDDLSTGRRENLAAVQDAAGKTVETVFDDINSAACDKAFREFRPEIVFHLAAQANVRRSVEEPDFDATTNVLGTIRLLEAAKDAAVKGFIFSSTGGAIYGEQESFPADENHRTTPECPYGVSKRAGELYVEYYARTFGFQGAALRYGNVFGPRQNPKGEAGVVAIFTDRLLQGQELIVNGDGEQTRDFVFVEDVVQANLLTAREILNGALHSERNFTVFNVGTGRETSVNDVVRAMKQACREIAADSAEKVPEIVVQHAPARLGEQRRSVIDTKKIERALGWKVRTGFEEGLSATIRSYRPVTKVA